MSVTDSTRRSSPATGPHAAIRLGSLTDAEIGKALPICPTVRVLGLTIWNAVLRRLDG